MVKLVRVPGSGSASGPGRVRGCDRVIEASMSVEELRSFFQVSNDISLELSDVVAFSTIGETDNAVYFTWKQFATGLYFPV